MAGKVFVTRVIPDAGLDRIRENCEVDLWEGEGPPPYEILNARVQAVDGILCLLTDQIDAALMDSAGPSLKVISQMAVGYDNIDTAAARERGILVGNTPGVLTDATADLAFALILAGARRLLEAVDYIRDGMWTTWQPQALLGQDMKDATLGIVGFGRIGQAVAKRASGFEMRILAYNPNPKPDEAAALGVEMVELEALLQQADFVSLHVPLNAQTSKMIDGKVLEMMKQDAILINTARGGVVDQDALVEALQTGTIGGAALDVTDPEPIDFDDPLMHLPNCLVVPHIGSASVKTRALMASMAADNLLAGLDGRPLPNRVE